MAKLILILIGCFLFSSALPAAAAGPFNIHPPASASGIDPQAVTVVGSPQRHLVKKGDDLLKSTMSKPSSWWPTRASTG